MDNAIFTIINKDCQFVRNNDYFTEKYLLKLFHENQVYVKLFFVSPKEIEALVKNLLSQHQEEIIIIVGGGDGTVSSVANLLVNNKAKLGILPLGTLNHFAKDLNIPTDISECMKVYKNGRVKQVDVACINDRVFINNASIGFYPKLVKERDKQMRWYNLGKFSAMFLSAINIFHRFPIYHVKVVTKNKDLDLKTPLVFIGNNEYDLVFFTFKSRQSIQEGELCIYVVNSKNRWQFLKLLLFMLFGILDQSRDFIKILTQNLLLDAKGEQIHVAIDGEIVSFNNPLQCKIMPKKLSVIVP